MVSRQAPIGSGFGRRTTAQQALEGRDLTGINAVVTGGYSGLGLETAEGAGNGGSARRRSCSQHEKARSAVEDLPGIELAELDLAKPVSIDAFTARYLATGRPLHILVNSAGIMATPLERDARGYESQFATNHLGHFQLTAGLWPALRRADRARVVSVSSLGHRFSPVDFDDPNFVRRRL